MLSGNPLLFFNKETVFIEKILSFKIIGVLLHGVLFAGKTVLLPVAGNGKEIKIVLFDW